MRKLIDINSFKKESREKFNLIHASEKESRIKNFLEKYGKIALKGLSILIALVFLWKLAVLSLALFKKQNNSEWQAVFLSNNQTYFGHILETSNGYIVLEKVYYFKVVQGSQSSQQLNLVKLKDEIYGPEDLMRIPDNQITFWQNLRDDSQVVKIIKQLEEKDK